MLFLFLRSERVFFFFSQNMTRTDLSLFCHRVVKSRGGEWIYRDERALPAVDGQAFLARIIKYVDMRKNNCFVQVLLVKPGHKVDVSLHPSAAPLGAANSSTLTWINHQKEDRFRAARAVRFTYMTATLYSQDCRSQLTKAKAQHEA